MHSIPTVYLLRDDVGGSSRESMQTASQVADDMLRPDTVLARPTNNHWELIRSGKDFISHIANCGV
jgi:hypothetical protein